MANCINVSIFAFRNVRHSIELYDEIVEKYPTDLHALKLAQMICLYRAGRETLEIWSAVLEVRIIIVRAQNRLLFHIDKYEIIKLEKRYFY